MADHNNLTPDKTAPQQQPNTPQRPAPDQQQKQGGEHDKSPPAPGHADKPAPAADRKDA
jgi:hypothetical protein